MNSSSSDRSVITRERYLSRLKAMAVTIAVAQDQVLETDSINRWAETTLQRLADQGRLVSEQQYQDHAKGRVLREGDRAKYIGPDRTEETERGSQLRPHGQTGTVYKTEKRGEEMLIYFRPDAPSPVQHVVDLVVMTGTPGYVTLERLP